MILRSIESHVSGRVNCRTDPQITYLFLNDGHMGVRNGRFAISSMRTSVLGWIHVSRKPLVFFLGRSMRARLDGKADAGVMVAQQQNTSNESEKRIGQQNRESYG